ncbi:SMI1/KNR4 family protein [Listeria welshimeri]|uniref:SMI1/KNR4 family protein n=1 Tax=Listeria welshimeri TaxID=1643 RepID=UPI001627502E|nr:SMI1/KNR4 family protein [Listeria welshimeri]MBC1340254.1 SMI1/KNR4 family protein [Listeria welshimeri]MBC1342944.1 SMI1/KNR4 family protein [Listeria welshimeri]MBC1347125.1 SMI1/KNR4 family protein [Listeria welshimeri]MBC1362010.1 SMI1/KNR4 family protein [Listeria welshimeri]MBC1365046.1 SMI1/KNR4 family protein [Listeria welshimeri]
MNNIIELVKKNEQLFLKNAEELNGEELEQEDIDAYLAIQGATEEELAAFEHQFQLKLPEDFKSLYKYKNGSGSMSLIWPQEGFYRGYRFLSLQEISAVKIHFQHENREMTEFPDTIDQKQLKQLDKRIKPYLFCKSWFPFAEYANSLYLMLDYEPSEKGLEGQIISYVHDPDFIYYIAPNITETLKMTEVVIENLV